MERPFQEFDAYERWLDGQLVKLPKCCCCEEPIQSDFALCIDGEWYCESCEQDNAKDLWNDYGRNEYVKGVEVE